MSVQTLERPKTVRRPFVARPQSGTDVHRSGIDPNWGPEDLHAIRAIAYLMTGIFTVALVMYGTITLLAGLHW